MITLDEIRAAVEQVVSENPDAVNPVNQAACLYTKLAGDTTPNVAEHCLGGTVVLKLGQPLPGEGRGFRFYGNGDGTYSPEAFEYLCTLQGLADRADRVGRELVRRPWSKVLNMINEAYEVF